MERLFVYVKENFAFEQTLCIYMHKNQPQKSISHDGEFLYEKNNKNEKSGGETVNSYSFYCVYVCSTEHNEDYQHRKHSSSYIGNPRNKRWIFPLFSLLSIFNNGKLSIILLSYLM